MKKTHEQQLWDRVEESMRASVAAGRPPIDLGRVFKELDDMPLSEAAALLVDEPPSGGPE